MDFVLDSVTHDIKITNKDLTLSPSVAAETAQRLKIKLQNYRGEWFRDIYFGVPWYEILSQSGNREVIDNYIKATILEDNEVISIIEYSSEKVGTLLNVYFTAQHRSGETITLTIGV